jgi:hypothetical protein
VRNPGLAQPGATVLPNYAQVLFPPILARFEIVSGADPRAREGYGGWVLVFLGEETRDKEGWTLSCFHDKKGVGMDESR